VSSVSYKYDSYDGTVVSPDGSRSNGGSIHPPDDGSSGNWCSSSKAGSNMQSASTRRGSPRPLASSTPLNDKPEDYNPSDDIRNANNTPREQWDPYLGMGKSSPASGHPPFVAFLKPPSSLSGKPGGVDWDGSVRDPSTLALLPSIRPALGTINPSALSNSAGRSDARSQSSVRHKDGDVPDPFLSKNTQCLLDFVIPDLTREIHNKTLVAGGGYSLVFCAERKRSQGSPAKVGSRFL
jgi:hypothetical protein